MNYKEKVETLLTFMSTNPKLKSVDYGTVESFDENKGGETYPRAYLSLVDAGYRDVTLQLAVTQSVKPDLSDRLESESTSLTIIKEVIQMFIAKQYLKPDDEREFKPTKLYQRDQSTGWTTDIDILLLEDIDVCDITNPNTN